MRAWRLHIVFATILVGSLAAKERAAEVVVEVDNADLMPISMHPGEARPSGVLCRADEICGARDVWPDALRAIRALASGRLAAAVPGRRCDRLAESLEPRLRSSHPGRYRGYEQ